MKNKKKILGIVGIRSGSSSLKNKNIKILGNKPLVGWILSSAKKSKYINRLVVSTDSKKYAKISQKYGAETPYLRPKHLATKFSDEIGFIKHLINHLRKKENYNPDIVVRLLATVPFQKVTDIDKIIKLVLKNKYDSAVIISKAKQHPYKALKIIGNTKKYLVSFRTNKGIDVGRKNNRQLNEKFENIYFRSNVIACKTKVIRKYNSLCSSKTGYFIIPQTVDIDDEVDFKFANFLLKDSSKKNKNF